MLWDVSTWQPAQSLKGHTSQISALALSPDGKALASVAHAQASTFNTIKLWDIASGRVLHDITNLHPDPLVLAISPDGQELAAAGWGDRVTFLDLTTGTIERQIEGGEFGHFTTLAFSPDGMTLAGAGWGSRAYSVTLLDLRSDRFQPLEESVFRPAVSLAFSPDGRTLAVGRSSGEVERWDRSTRQLLHTYRGHTDGVNAVVFSSSGDRIISSSKDGRILGWKVPATPAENILLRHDRIVWSVAMSADWKTAVSGGKDCTLRVWDIAEHRQVALLQSGWSNWGGVSFVALSPNGKTLVASLWGGRPLEVWDVPSQRLLKQVTNYSGMPAFSHKGDLLLLFHADNPSREMQLWDATASRQLTVLGKHQGALRSAFSSDDRLLATCGLDSTVKVWDVPRGKLLKTFLGHTEEVYCIAFSPDGRLLASGGQDRMVKLWNVRSLGSKPIASFTANNFWAVNTLAFSPDGKTLAIAGFDDQIRLWSVAARREVMVLKEAGIGSSSVLFSPDGELLAAGCRDGSVRFWRAPGQSHLDVEVNPH